MTIPLKVLLADDDQDDCELFETALKELPVEADLTTVYDGDEFLKELNTVNSELPDLSGTITATGVPGQGASFEIRIPNDN